MRRGSIAPEFFAPLDGPLPRKLGQHTVPGIPVPVRQGKESGKPERPTPRHAARFFSPNKAPSACLRTRRAPPRHSSALDTAASRMRNLPACQKWEPPGLCPIVANSGMTGVGQAARRRNSGPAPHRATAVEFARIPLFVVELVQFGGAASTIKACSFAATSVLGTKPGRRGTSNVLWRR